MSITVTCTFLKSNRFLLVGVFVSCGIRAARLTQRLSRHPPQLTVLTIHSCSQSLPRSSAPALPAKPSASPAPLPRLSRSRGPCDCYLQDFCVTGRWKTTVSLLHIISVGASPSGVLSFTYIIFFDGCNPCIKELFSPNVPGLIIGKARPGAQHFDPFTAHCPSTAELGT